MIHSNGAFPCIKGNPTTNYCITPADEARENIEYWNALHGGKPWPPHEAYIGESTAVLTTKA